MAQARTSKLVILKENACAQEIKEKVANNKACSLLESAIFISESNKDCFEHDYARPMSSKERNKQKSKKDPKTRGRPPAQQQRQATGIKIYSFGFIRPILELWNVQERNTWIRFVLK